MKMLEAGQSRLLLLATMWQNSTNGLCVVPVPLIAKSISLSDKQTRRLVEKLVAEGAITREHTNGARSKWRLNTRPEDYQAVNGTPGRKKGFSPQPTMIRMPAKFFGKVVFDWTNEQLTLLPELWASGLTTQKIAEKLKFPWPEAKNSIISKVHRMNLPSRASPIVRSVDGPKHPSHARKPARPAPSLPLLPSEGGALLFDYAALVKPIVFTAPKPRAPKPPRPIVERPMLVNFRSSTPPRPASSRLYADGCLMGPSINPCQFVVVEGSVITPWVHCGVDVVKVEPDPNRPFVKPPEAPYCAAHRRVCFYNPRVSQEAA